MKRINFLKYTNKTLVLSILFLALFSGGLVAFATPPGSQYTSNETLDPTCAPGDANCSVATDGSLLIGSTNIFGTETWLGATAGDNAGSTDNTVFIGTSAGDGATDADYSVLIGFQAGKDAVTAGNSNFIGRNAGLGATNANNSNFIGTLAGNGATDVINANFIGSQAGDGATAAEESNFIGDNAGYGATDASFSNFIGIRAGQDATGASMSTFIGDDAGNAAVNASGSLFFGSNAGQNATDALSSIFVGSGAGQDSSTAAHSIFIGDQAGNIDSVDNTISGTSILIGDNTSTGGFSDSIAIGASATNTMSDQFLIAPSYVNWQIAGLDYVMPSALGNPGDVLTDVAGDGTLTWEAGGGGSLIGQTSSDETETWLGDQAGVGSATDRTVFIGLNAGVSSPDAINSVFVGSNAGNNADWASQSVFIGDNAGLVATNALRSTFLGNDAGDSASDAEYSVFIGSGSGYDADNASHSTFIGYAGSGAVNAANSIFIGDTAGINDTVNNTVSGHSILLGDLTSTGGFKNSIAIGTAATNTAINQLVIGGNGYAISNGFFGNGVTNASPSGFTLNTTGGSGSNIAGGALAFAGGKGTGNAAGGAIIFSTSDAGASGTTLQSLTEKARITAAGKLNIGTTPTIGMLNIGMPDNIVVGSSTTFYDGGSGLDDATFTGTYSGTTPNIIYIVIDSTGTPDTFEWYDDLSECGGSSGVAITGGAQSLCNGVSVTFGATTGHAVSDEWHRSYAEVTGVANAITVTNIGGTQGGFFLNVGPQYSNFIGSGAGTGTNGGAWGASESNFIGLMAGYQATSAGDSNFIGYQAGYYAANAINSSFFGSHAGDHAINAIYSNFIGYNAGYWATNAIESNFIGRSAGSNATNASQSNFIGWSAGNGATNATYSNFIGYQAGDGADNASNSIFIGYAAGVNDAVDNTSGTTSILIGDTTSTGGYSNSIALGASATNTAVNQFMIGSTASPIDATRINGSASTQCTITTGTGIACTSDERLKTNIEDLDTNILDNLLKVKTVTYNWDAQPDGSPMIGFLAQDLEQYFPELVATDSTGYKSVYYSQITPILVEAIRELDLKITNIADLTQENNSLVGQLIAWFANSANGITDFFAQAIHSKESHTDKLCVSDTNGETCITRSELDALLINAVPQTPQAPPTDTPPQDAPPTDVPPAETPPVETPPSDAPPIDVVPPVETPPAQDVPPVENPPAPDAPPADALPADAPSI